MKFFIQIKVDCRKGLAYPFTWEITVNQDVHEKYASGGGFESLKHTKEDAEKWCERYVKLKAQATSYVFEVPS